MALIHFSISPASCVHPSPSISGPGVHRILASIAECPSISSSSKITFSLSVPPIKEAKKYCLAFTVRSGLDTAGPTAAIGQVTEVTEYTFWPIVMSSADKTYRHVHPMELGIRVVPTFKILKDKKIVKEVTGANFDELVAAIEAVRSS